MKIINYLCAVFCVVCIGFALTACGDDNDVLTECVTQSFTMDGTIHPLCGIDEVPNHAVIEGLVLGGGTFILYARTNSDGSGGGVFSFSGDDISITYRGAGAGVVTLQPHDLFKHWLIGFHQENPAVHVVVKRHESDPGALEDAASYFDIHADEWDNDGSSFSERFYYKGTGGVAVTSVKIFHEEHHH